MFDEEYRAQEERTSPAVQLMHRLPRFGHGSDFSKIVSSDLDEQTDYVVGVLAVSFFVLSLFAFWSAVLLTLKCLGRRRVGVCAGGRAAVLVSDDKGPRARPPSRLWRLRGAFAVLGGGLLVLGAALVGPGLRSVGTASASTRRLNRNARDVVTQGLLITDVVTRVRWNIDALDVAAILRVEEACPNLREGAFLADEGLRASVRGIEDEFESLEGYLEGSDLEGIRRQINRVLDGTDHIDAAVAAIDENDWIVRMFALFLNVLVSFMIFAACAALCRGNCNCNVLPALSFMVAIFILPFFIGLIVCSWFATSVLAVASIVNADFCVGSSQHTGPAGTLVHMLEERGIANDDIAFAAFSYYQSNCATEDPIKHLYKYEDGIQSGIGSANEFLTQAYDVGIDEINVQCGADVRPTIEGIELVKDNLGILLSALRSTFELGSCMKMSPLYEQFEETACTDSSGSLALIFVIMFGISVVGMLMIMLRSAMYPSQKLYLTPFLDEEEDEWEEYQAYLRYMASFVTMWGGTEDDTILKAGTVETTPSSTASIAKHHLNSPKSILSDEEMPLSPETPALDALFNGAETTERMYENEEALPLSPDTPALGASFDRAEMLDRMNEDEEQRPLSPETPALGAPFNRDGRTNKMYKDEEQRPLSPETPASDARFNRAEMMEHMYEDEEQLPLSPETPALDASFKRAEMMEQMFEDEEQLPLSPESQLVRRPDQFIMYTPRARK